jgi:hypothetical protein
MTTAVTSTPTVASDMAGHKATRNTRLRVRKPPSKMMIASAMLPTSWAV